MITGDVDIVVSTDEYPSCSRCKSKVKPVNATISECIKCASLLKTARCTVASTTKIIVGGNKDRVITLFDNIIGTLVDLEEEGSLGVKLLDLPPHQFSVGDNNTVYAVKKL